MIPHVVTVAELDALPNGSVVLDDNDVVCRRNPWMDNDPPLWFPLDGPSAFDRDFGLAAEDVSLPVRVLWVGDAA